MDLEKLKDYIQQELEKITGNKEELNQTKEQLSLFKTEFDNLFINNELDTFQELFKQNELGISFEKVKEAVSVITFFNQLNTTDIPQYQDAYNDLQELKKQIDVLITSIDDRIQIIENNNDKFNILKDALDILNKEDLNGFYNDEEISKLFNAIKVLTIDAREKMDLIYNITSINVQKKLTSRVEHSIKISSDDLVLSSIEENIDIVTELLDSTDEYSDELIQESDVLGVDEVQSNVEETINDPLLDKIQELVNQLSKYYDVQNFWEITSQTGILERKEIYSSNNEISKYNWPLIYVDLCKNLIPMYKEGNDKDQIKELFEFIIEKYTNYESVCEEFDSETVLEINKYFNMIDNIDEDEVRKLRGQLENFNQYGLECENISKTAGSKTFYTNEQIELYYFIFELRDGYDLYKQERENELKNRFSSDLMNCINNVKEYKQYILDTLVNIKKIEHEISTKLDTPNDDEIDNPDIDDDEIEQEEDKNIYFIEDNKTPSLVVFMDVKNKDSILAHFKTIMENGKIPTLRNVVNCIYQNHYFCKNYQEDLVSGNSQYRSLSNDTYNKSLEPNEMYRSEKGKIRCPYRVLHLSDKNKEIIKQYYPKFSDTIFLITGIFYRVGKRNGTPPYISDTNSFVKCYQDKINYYVKLFSEDFKDESQVNEAIDLINNSFEQYNYICSIVKEKENKKEDKKGSDM